MRRYFVSLIVLLCVISVIGCSETIPQPATGSVLFNSEKTVVFPEATGYVVDTIGLLNKETKATIEKRCEAFDDTIQLAVCIINTTSPLSIEDYSIKLAEKWQIGHKGKDNGVILLIAQSDHKLRIEVGRGLESKITDAKAGQIINDVIVPKFKAGDFNGGIKMGVNYILTEASE